MNAPQHDFGTEKAKRKSRHAIRKRRGLYWEHYAIAAIFVASWVGFVWVVFGPLIIGGPPAQP